MESVDGLFAAIEKHLGVRTLKALLIIVALAVAISACSAIYKLGISPVLAAFGLKLDLSSAWGVLFLVLQLAGAAAITSTILDAYRKRIAREEIERLLSRGEALSNAIAKQRELVRDLTRSSIDISRTSGEFLAGTELILAAIHERAKEQRLLDEEQLAAISEMVEATSQQARKCALMLDDLTSGIIASDSVLEHWVSVDEETGDGR